MNLITLISLREEFLTALGEKVKFGFDKSRTHREQLQWTKLTPQTRVGVERKHQPGCVHSTAVLQQCLLPQAGSSSRPVGKVLPEGPSPISSD